MGFNTNKFLAAGTKVRVTEPREVPTWSTWDDDKGRTSTPVKKRLQTMFFKVHKKITAEVVYIARESEREKLRRKGQIKLRIRDTNGSMLSITADPKTIKRVA